MEGFLVLGALAFTYYVTYVVVDAFGYVLVEA